MPVVVDGDGGVDVVDVGVVVVGGVVVGVVVGVEQVFGVDAAGAVR